MRNSPGLPIGALVAAAVLASAAGLARVVNANGTAPLSEVEIGLAAWAFVLGVFGVQGLISILLEGTALRLGRSEPRLTLPLTVAIVLLATLLFGLAGLLGAAILTGQSTLALGLTAGAGCLVLAVLLVAYKEAFVGDEARLDLRQDGVPW